MSFIHRMQTRSRSVYKRLANWARVSDKSRLHHRVAPYLSLRIALFSFFQWSLKSEENSCQMQKTVLGETSFSPALAFTEKNTVSSRNLTGKNTAHQIFCLNLIILCKETTYTVYLYIWLVCKIRQSPAIILCYPFSLLIYAGISSEIFKKSDQKVDSYSLWVLLSWFSRFSISLLAGK